MLYQRFLRVLILSFATAAAFAVPIVAQQRGASAARALTTADYARAEQFMTWNTTPLLFRSGVRPTWLDGDRFWYRITTPSGSEAILVDPVKGTKEPCTLPACVAALADAGRGGCHTGSSRSCDACRNGRRRKWANSSGRRPQGRP